MDYYKARNYLRYLANIGVDVTDVRARLDQDEQNHDPVWGYNFTQGVNRLLRRRQYFHMRPIPGYDPTVNWAGVNVIIRNHLNGRQPYAPQPRHQRALIEAVQYSINHHQGQQPQAPPQPPAPQAPPQPPAPQAPPGQGQQGQAPPQPPVPPAAAHNQAANNMAQQYQPQQGQVAQPIQQIVQQHNPAPPMYALVPGQAPPGQAPPGQGQQGQAPPGQAQAVRRSPRTHLQTVPWWNAYASLAMRQTQRQHGNTSHPGPNP